SCVGLQSTPEAVEVRRRERYDTLAALNTAGYAPVQSDRISYVKLQRDIKTRKASRADGLPLPYEWVQPPPPTAGSTPRGGFDAVCVVWLSEDPDQPGKPATLRFLKLVKKNLEDAVRNRPGPPTMSCRFAITGRLGSTQLADIIGDDNNVDPAGSPLTDV